MNLPDELVYKILSYLPSGVLRELNMSNKQYWNIYRMKSHNSKGNIWDSKVVWLEQLLETDRMTLNGQLYVMSLTDLEMDDDLYNYRLPTESTTVTFQKYLDGYIWHPASSAVNLGKVKQILNTRDGTGLSGTYWNGSTENPKIIGFFNKYLLEYLSKLSEDYLPGKIPKRKIKRLDDYHNTPFLFYLTEKPNFETEDLELIDRIKIDEYMIWKVIKTNENSEKSEIGRAVICPELHCMMGDQAGVALFANGTEDKKYNVFGFGNIDYSKEGRWKLVDDAVTDSNCYNIVGERPYKRWAEQAKKLGHGGTVLAPIPAKFLKNL